MILDQQNIFFDAATSITSGSNVIVNEAGDAGDPLFLVAKSTAKETASLTFTLKTSDSEAMSGAVNLGVFASPANAEGVLVAAKIPYGAKKYLSVTGSGTPAGKITVALVSDVDNWYK